MNQQKVTRVTRLQSLPVHSRRGFSIISIIVVIAVLAIVAGLLLPKIVPKRKIPAAFDEVGVGRMEGNLCISDFFSLSIRVPEGWQVMPRDDLKSFIAKQNKSDQQNMAVVLVAARALKPAPGIVEPMLMVAGRRLSSIREVKTVEDFMEHTQRIRERKRYNTGDPGKPYEAVVGGKAWLRLDAGQRYGNGVVDSVLLARLSCGYALTIAGAWQTEEDRRALMQSLQTVQFRQP